MQTRKERLWQGRDGGLTTLLQMSYNLPAHRLPSPPNQLVSYYRRGGSIRSRSVSDVVLSCTVDVPALPSRLTVDWEREIALGLQLEPGDVEALPLARARMRWPDFRQCVKAVSDWTREPGLSGVLAACDADLMACRGARYHHDAAQYGAAAFCNLFLSEDKGLDLHFPMSRQRIPLTRGTAVIFDTGQPHAVVQRGSCNFQVADFPPGSNCSLVFLTWELSIENADVASALRIDFDSDPLTASLLDQEQLRLDGAKVSLCPESGQWRVAG